MTAAFWKEFPARSVWLLLTSSPNDLCFDRQNSYALSLASNDFFLRCCHQTFSISPLAPERRKEEKCNTSSDVCGNANFWGYWRGGRGRALTAFLSLSCSVFVKGNDEKTFLYSKECNSNKTIYNLSTSLLKEWL